MGKTIEQMVEEVKEESSRQNTRSDSGYDYRSVNEVVASDDKKAIAYEIKGSQWHRGGTYGGGVSYFQGINAHDGEVGLVIKGYGCYRADYFHPEELYNIERMTHLEGRKYEVVVGNEYKERTYLVDFEEKKVEKTQEKTLNQRVISGPEANDW